MELIRLLPDIYDNNETMQLLQGILSQEVTTLDAGMYHTIDQCYVGSSSEDGTLSRYERLLGISPDTSKSERYRKERIKAKIFGAGTTTASLIHHIAESYTNAAVELTEQFAELHCDSKICRHVWNTWEYCGYQGIYRRGNPSSS